MVDTTNNTADNSEEQENPQSILEKRLAEINSRKDEGQSRPTEEVNATEVNQGDAVAAPNVLPAESVALEDSTIIPDSLTSSAGPAAATQNPGTVAHHHSAENTGTVNDQVAGNMASTEAAVGAAGILPVTTPFTAPASQSPAPETDHPSPIPEPESLTGMSGPADENRDEPSGDTEANSPELLSTAGVISDPLGMNTNAQTTNPEAASAIPDTPVTENNGGENTADEISLEDEPHEDLATETDYSTLSIAEVRVRLAQTLKNATRQQSREIFELYRQYETKHAEERTEALHRFTEEGGSPDDFEYKPGPEHTEIEKAFQQFRESRSREQRQDEEQKVKNAKRKQELLDQLRELVESPETKSSGDKIKQIQSEWKGIGPVPAADSKQLWNSYHALLDIFYNNRSIFNELKELDRRRNLQHKIQLCERAESLIEQPSINVALQELRNLHEEWKHVGPVPNEHRDSIWERFIQASEKVHGRKKDFITARKSVEMDNLVKKSELLGRMEPYQNFQTDRINDWRDKTDEIQKLKEEWDAIGLVPKERADEINKRFWSSYKAFFNHKNAFFKNLDEQKMQNLRLKTELCEQAESLKNSENWEETKETLIQLQKKWKTVGRVPDKYSEKLWQRFRSACNEFFDRKQNQVTQRENEITQSSQAKSGNYERLATRMTTINTEPGTVAEFEQIRDEYLALPVTKFSGKTDDRFFDLLQKYVASIADLTNDEKDNLAAELQVTRLKTGPDANNRIHQKEQAIKRDIGQLENDIRTLKTNIEFFGRSKNAEKLREEYNARIEEADHRIQQLQRQLYMIRNA